MAHACIVRGKQCVQTGRAAGKLPPPLSRMRHHRRPRGSRPGGRPRSQRAHRKPGQSRLRPGNRPPWPAYDRRGAHLKTLTADGFKQYLDRYWQADEMSMTNHLTGKGTVMIWTDNRYRTDLDERDFTQTGLKRVR